MTLANDFLPKIHSAGYWRINIRPTSFDKKRIASLRECKQIMISSQVSLRGWSYPHLRDGDIISGQDWVEYGHEWMQYIEYWRFYQSAQFIQHLASREDHAGLSNAPKQFISPLSTLYSFTEIFEFASRLAKREILQPEAEILIKLIGLKDHILYEPGRPLSFINGHVCRINEIIIEKTVSDVELIAHKSELALRATMDTFERFNWDNPPEKYFAEQQLKFIERRI